MFERAIGLPDVACAAVVRLPAFEDTLRSERQQGLKPLRDDNGAAIHRGIAGSGSCQHRAQDQQVEGPATLLLQPELSDSRGLGADDAR